MGKPVITYDSVEMSPVFYGSLVDGGRIGNEPMVLEVHLICLAYRKKVNDLEIILTFNEYDSVRLTIRKECDTIGEIQEYFTILYVIYWILLILIIVFLIAILLYYMKKNEITFNDIIEKTVETCKALFSNEKRKQHKPSNLKEELYEENDLIDIKITTNKLNNNNTPINRQGNSSSYGGI